MRTSRTVWVVATFLCCAYSFVDLTVLITTPRDHLVGYSRREFRGDAGRGGSYGPNGDVGLVLRPARWGD